MFDTFMGGRELAHAALSAARVIEREGEQMTALKFGRRKIRRRWPFAIATTAVAAGLMLVIGPAGALTGSTFEIDGNRVVDTAGNIDWASPPPHYVSDADTTTGPTDESFSQGTKEDTAVPTIDTGSIPPNKSDLTRFESAWENLPVGTATHTFLYLAWTRTNNPGSADMDFELNQSSTLSANGQTPVRTAGDVLITFDFASGNNVVTTHFSKWTDTGPCEASGGKAPCWGTLSSNLTGNGADAAISADLKFGEMAIDLQAAGLVGSSSCLGFASGYLKSRSSDSFTSALKDFVPPANVNIVTCQPQKIKIKKVDGSNNPLSGAVMQLFKDVDASGTINTGDTQVAPDGWTSGTKDCTTTADGIGNCIFTFSTPSQNGTYIAHELTPPNGYTTSAPDVVQAITVGNTANTFTLTFSDSPAPATINILKQDDAGNAVNGAGFTLWVDAAPIGTSKGAEDNVSQATCVTSGTGADKGKCSMPNIPLGDYWLEETSVPAGYSIGTISPGGTNPVHVTAALGSTPGTGQTFSFTATDPRQHRYIVLVCHEGTNSLYASTVDPDGDLTGTSDQKSSLSSVPSALATKGVTEADLCGLGGATFGGLGHSTQSPKIVIGTH
jgi:hypothetical protein